MLPGLEPAELPADAVEVGRIHDAWGIKGWFKVLPTALPRKRFFIPALVPAAVRAGGQAGFRRHAAAAHPRGQGARGQHRGQRARGDDRSAAEALKGCRVFVPRSSFPTAGDDEYYWVDLIGLEVVNREGVVLGQVGDLMATGPQTVLVVAYEADGKHAERMIPFVSAYVDTVDLQGRRITVDWQPDY